MNRREWSPLAVICLLSVLCWLAVYGAIELLRMVWP